MITSNPMYKILTLVYKASAFLSINNLYIRIFICLFFILELTNLKFMYPFSKICLLKGFFFSPGIVNTTSCEVKDLVPGEKYAVQVSTVSKKVESLDAEEIEQTMCKSSL